MDSYVSGVQDSFNPWIRFHWRKKPCCCTRSDVVVYLWMVSNKNEDSDSMYIGKFHKWRTHGCSRTKKYSLFDNSGKEIFRINPDAALSEEASDKFKTFYQTHPKYTIKISKVKRISFQIIDRPGTVVNLWMLKINKKESTDYGDRFHYNCVYNLEGLEELDPKEKLLFMLIVLYINRILRVF